MELHVGLADSRGLPIGSGVPVPAEPGLGIGIPAKPTKKRAPARTEALPVSSLNRYQQIAAPVKNPPNTSSDPNPFAAPLRSVHQNVELLTEYRAYHHNENPTMQ